MTADDFGASMSVNQAVEVAHASGILTTTSLMVAAPAVMDAVNRAKELPKLRVGLHLVVVRGKPSLPPEQIPDIVGPDGLLDRNLGRAGVRYFFLPNVRRQLAREIRAQFEAFQATGLELDHANAHNHMHLHPIVLGLMIKIGREFGLRCVRLPWEPRGTVLLLPWLALMKWRLKKSKMVFNDFFFGMRDTGRMDSKTLQNFVDALPDGVSEIMLHPALDSGVWVEPEAVNFQFRDECAALIDPSVRAKIRAVGAELISFSDLISSR